jgi:hypothetical protein
MPMTAHLRTRILLAAAAAIVLGAGLASCSRLQATLKPNYNQIEDGLYLGGRVVAPPPGTGAVLNLTREADPYRAPVHQWEPIPDGPPAPSLDWLRRQVDFVTDQRKQGRVVYVHCRAGVSRSGMVVVAYEMAKNGWGFDEALRYVQSRRPVVSPNPLFRSLLREWEKSVRAAKAP